MTIKTVDVARVIGCSVETVRVLAKQGRLGTVRRTPKQRRAVYSVFKIAEFLGTTPEEVEKRLCSQ